MIQHASPTHRPALGWLPRGRRKAGARPCRCQSVSILGLAARSCFVEEDRHERSPVLHFRMAMGRRKDRARTPALWIATHELPQTGGHPFYQRLNQVLDQHGFDAFVEAQCAPFYAAKVGRPSLTCQRESKKVLGAVIEISSGAPR
jgi:hypothetical protein